MFVGDTGRVTLWPGHPTPVQPSGRRGIHDPHVAPIMRARNRRPGPALLCRSCTPVDLRIVAEKRNGGIERAEAAD